MKQIKTYLLVITFCACFSSGLPGSPPTTIERTRSFEEAHDTLHICQTRAMYTDRTESFITLPDDYPEIHDFDIAKTPPVVDFGIIQDYEPWYLPMLYKENYRLGGTWNGWGDVTMGPDNCYYFSVSDHRSYNANAYIICYDPVAKNHEIVVDLKKVIGWTPDEYADGKIHGDLDIGPGGDMWFLTYFGPRPREHEWDTVYRGSRLLHYNIFTKETEHLGIPLEGSSWPYYNYDWQRGVFFAVADYGGIVLAYDTKARKMLYGGVPKHHIRWFQRCTMLDRDTGIFYSSDTIANRTGERFRGDHYFVSYKRRNNTFIRMKAKVPENPATGKSSPVRAHTQTKDSDGAFWCLSHNGVLFRFFPDEDRTEYSGLNWGKEGYYTTNMCFSPKKRYIYYIPGVNVRALAYGTPVVQYDTETKKKKVIAFLNDFYFEKYGYCVCGPYGLELDRNGESLFFFSGGSFTDNKSKPVYRRPSMFHIHIPESERLE